MDDVRTPCQHRGSAEILESLIQTGAPAGPVTMCICRQCRRFWLERNGWLLSRRETVAILRSVPTPNALGFAR